MEVIFYAVADVASQPLFSAFGSAVLAVLAFALVIYLMRVFLEDL